MVRCRIPFWWLQHVMRTEAGKSLRQMMTVSIDVVPISLHAHALALA